METTQTENSLADTVIFVAIVVLAAVAVFDAIGPAFDYALNWLQ